MGFWRELSAKERSTFRACFGGWALDGMDFQLYSFVIPTVIAEWHLSKAQAGTIQTTTLLVSAAGGWLAGLLADRIGRVRTLQITILWFAVFTALSGFAQSYGQLLAARALMGLGFGGEWAAGAVLMGEVIGARHRGKAVGSVQSGWALGWGAAAVLYTIAFSNLPERTAWRTLFFAGIAPALLVLYIRRFVGEPEVFQKARAQSSPPASFLEIFSPSIVGTTALAALLATGAQGGYYAITTWLPTYLKTVRNLSVFNTGAYLGVVIAGSFCGYLVSAWLSDALGRRRNFFLFAIGSMAAVLSYTLLPITDAQMLFLGFPLGFFSSGIFSGMGAFFTELFPTRIRGSGQGFCYNFGRGVGALFPSVVGALSAGMPLGRAIGIFAASAYAVLFVAAVLLPETRGKELSLLELAPGAALLEPADPQEAAAALFESPPAGFLDAVPGARTLLVLYDPERFDRTRLSEAPSARRKSAPRTVRLEAVYDGPDLESVAAELGISAREVRRRHVEAEHRVAFLGFAPGFAYMTGGFPLPRLASPRVRVPAGSLAIADGYTGIYPAETPGGWRLIGRVAQRMFDPRATPPALLRPGDRAVFAAVETLPPLPPPAEREPPRDPVLRIVRAGAFTSIQGAPRYGLASDGVPAGGAMDLAALAQANELLGNHEGAAALEITLAGPELLALRDLRVAHRGEVRFLRRGETLRCGAMRNGLREYLAVENGLEVPPAGVGTRLLRAGEEIAVAASQIGPTRRAPQAVRGTEIRALVGPQWDRFTDPDAFFAQEWTVSPQSDRRGVRLQGAPLRLRERADIPPEGTAPGAVQVPGDGLPIALGPDRPVTGGYAKIATVLWDDLPLLAQARPGSRLRFVKARPR